MDWNIVRKRILTFTAIDSLLNIFDCILKSLLTLKVYDYSSSIVGSQSVIINSKYSLLANSERKIEKTIRLLWIMIYGLMP